ncbi:uncharacterized protein SCHCODRAFT_02701810 [Schizophyllum commune H4-8]|uniref:uncharacterized protein n=1 Tax=Schizophyllum commune (strain H4-8 / FGSC 9210) TaxID=578458 RepID=UPI00215DF007|nr:uncharacterized protein SCHCODRAFT_02701810 [Schizophyllum commune H4-8]KAI5890900.1 hypothetical protein SCHCODRAFT_02701810 [Schizophyllum commune H4-8]
MRAPTRAPQLALVATHATSSRRAARALALLCSSRRAPRAARPTRAHSLTRAPARAPRAARPGSRSSRCTPRHAPPTRAPRTPRHALLASPGSRSSRRTPCFAPPTRAPASRSERRASRRAPRLALLGMRFSHPGSRPWLVAPATSSRSDAHPDSPPTHALARAPRAPHHELALLTTRPPARTPGSRAARPDSRPARTPHDALLTPHPPTRAPWLARPARTSRDARLRRRRLTLRAPHSSLGSHPDSRPTRDALLPRDTLGRAPWLELFGTREPCSHSSRRTPRRVPPGSHSSQRAPWLALLATSPKRSRPPARSDPAHPSTLEHSRPPTPTSPKHSHPPPPARSDPAHPSTLEQSHPPPPARSDPTHPHQPEAIPPAATRAEMAAGNEGPHATVRKEHQAFARKLYQIEKDARALLKGQEPTVLNLVRGIQRDKTRATILKKKLISLSDAIAQARKMRETGPWAPTAAIQGAMFFLFDCLKASDPESKWYALQEIARPRYVINVVGLDIPTHDATLRAADRDRVPRRANEDLDVLLLQQPQLPADYVAVEAKRCGLGEVKLSGCAPATPAQRSHPGQKAHRNDKNKGVTKRKRAAKRKVATDSDSDEAEVEEPEPARKRTRSQTKAAASTSKGKGRAKAGPSSARGRRGKKVATPSDVEEEEEEERSQPESEERDVVPPVRFRVDWDRRPRDADGELLPYVETEDDAQMLEEQAEEQERLADEEEQMLRIKEEIRAHNEQRMLAGLGDDDAPEWPVAGSSGLQPGWTHLPDAEDKEDGNAGHPGAEEEEEELEDDDAEPPALPSPKPAAPSRFPTPEWMREGPSGDRPAELL